MGDIAKNLESIQKIWHMWIGLLAAIFLIISAIAVVLKQLGLPTLVNAITCGVVSIIILAIWYFNRKLPKTKKGKIGFVVCISCEDEQSHNRIREDFILTLRKLITAGQTGNYFHFIEIPMHTSCNVVDVEDALKLRIMTRAHFVLYGRSRTRFINSKEHNCIELDGIVTHTPTLKEVQQNLSSEFTELLPRKIAIDKDNDLFAFDLTTEWTELVAKYIIAIACTVSGDLRSAELLYSDVKSKLLCSNNNIPAYSKLKERLPTRLAEIYEAKATYCLNSWYKTHDISFIKQMRDELIKIELRMVSIRTIYLRAICSFLIDRDIDEAIKFIKSCPKSSRDAVWHFNLAFLEAYRGNMKRAMQHYRNAIKFNIDAETINQLESFIVIILAEEPEKSQLHFCLGYIDWKIKGDNLQAIDDYSKFVELADEIPFSEEIFYAKKWIDELRALNYDAN